MIPLSEVLQALAPVTVDAGLQAFLTTLIDNSTAALGRELGRYLGPPQVVSETYAGGRCWIILRDDPTPGEPVIVKTRASLLVNWLAPLNPADVRTLVAGVDYGLDGRQLFYASGWPRGLGLIQVTYTRGFAEGTGPSELRQLVRNMVLEAWRRNVASNTSFGEAEAGLKSETIGDYSYSQFDGGFDIQAVAPESAAGWLGAARRWRRMLGP